VHRLSGDLPGWRKPCWISHPGADGLVPTPFAFEQGPRTEDKGENGTSGCEYCESARPFSGNCTEAALSSAAKTLWNIDHTLLLSIAIDQSKIPTRYITNLSAMLISIFIAEHAILHPGLACRRETRERGVEQEGEPGSQGCLEMRDAVNRSRNTRLFTVADLEMELGLSIFINSFIYSCLLHSLVQGFYEDRRAREFRHT